MDMKTAAQNIGVEEVVGFCDDRIAASDGSTVGGPDLAYDVTERAELSVATNNLFPGECACA